MRKEGDLSDFEFRLVGLSFSKIADILGFSYANIAMVYRKKINWATILLLKREVRGEWPGQFKKGNSNLNNYSLQWRYIEGHLCMHNPVNFEADELQQ